MAKFGIEVMNLIATHYPLALKGDAEQLARVTADLATTFGGLIAFSLRLNSRDHSEAVIRKIVELMLEQAGIIDRKAIEKIFAQPTQGNA